MKFQHSDFIHIDRELAKRSLAEFVKMAWQVLEPGQPYIHGWHMDAMAEHFEALASGDITRLLINIPPGTSKSTLASVMFPAWLWGPHGKPHLRIIGASYEQSLATRDNRRNRLLVESEWYQERWPLRLASDQNEKTGFENEHKGWRQSCPVKSMTGKRGDVVIWGDPQSPEKAHSEVDRETTIRVFKETLPTRLNNPKSSAIVVIQQRLHQDDVSGLILSEDYGYTHLCLPMEYVPGDRCSTAIGWKDPRTKEGELLFEERFPAEVVERDKKIMGSFAVAGQFQQNPKPRGGGLFRDDWWGYYTILPAVEWRAIYADTAQKTKQEHDYSVFQCWGRSHKGQAVLIDQIRGKWEAPELLRQATAFWNKHSAVQGKGILRAFKVEDKVSGTTLIQTLKKQGLPMIPIQRNIDKIVRGHDAAPFIESGNVLLPAEAAFLSEFLDEASMFPNGKHDDQMDPMMDAVTDILHGGALNPRMRAL